MRVVEQCVEQLRRGAPPAELAMRARMGRPRALSETEAAVCCAVYERDEATIFELGAVYRVHPITIKNALKRGGVW